ncbi:hypothetical protein ACFQ4G_15900, partial [Methylobacterium marchantiae]
MDWLAKLLDLGLGGLPSAASALCPAHLKQRALERLGDHNPFKTISANHDLTRATRLAWIEAAQEIMKAARAAVGEREWRAEADAVARFHGLVEDALLDARALALDRRKDPGASPIDRHVQAVMDGVPELVSPGRHEGLGRAVTGGFVEALAALSGWPEPEIPTVYGRIALSGLMTKGDGPARAFGELVFAAFAEIIKSPKKYPEAREAFYIAMEKVARDIGQATLDAVQGQDAKLDAVIAGLDGLEVLRAGALRYLDLLPRIAEDAAAARRAAEGVSAQFETIQRQLHALAIEKGVPEAPLQAVLRRLGETDVPASEIPARLDKAAEEILRLRDDLLRLTNDRPEFAAIRERALALIDDGRLDEARSALREGREAARALREEIGRSEARFLSDEARIDRLQLSHAAACDKLTEAARLDPGDVWIAIDLGDLWILRGSLDRAQTSFHGALRAAKSGGDERDLSVSHSRIGDVLRAQGDLSGALASFTAGLSIAEGLSRSDPGNAEW